MPRTCIPLHFLFILAAAFADMAQAQSVIFRVRTGTGTQLVQQGGTITVPAQALGSSLDFQIGVLYQGGGTASLTRYELAGSTDFRIISAPNIPVVLRTDDEARWTVRFQPKSSANINAQFAVTVRESALDGTLLTQYVSGISLVGTSPEIVTAQITPDGNSLPLNTGGLLTFPLTTSGSVSLIPIAVLNRGSGPSRLESVSVDSPNFQVVGLPLLPAAIDPPGELRFSIRYAPRSAGAHTGTVRIRSTDSEVLAALSGESTDPLPNAAVLRYYRFDGSDKIPLEPGDTIPFPDVPVNQRSAVKFRVENTGLSESSALFATADGTGFSLAEGSVQVIIQPSSGIDLTLVFQSDQPGSVEGRLLVGGFTFALRGTALGPLLRYRYESGAGAQSLTQGGRIYLRSTPLGVPQKATFSIENAGNQATSVQGIQLANGQASIQLEAVPEVPFNLAAGESTSFVINFTPSAVNTFTDVLLIGQASFDVSGTGLKPIALPDYVLTSSISTLGPAQQGSISLRLSEPYPLKLTGTVTLRINPNGVGVDPAAQFAIGGRSVSFKIAANTTNAVFDVEGAAASFQGGTVTSTLVFAPTFTTLAGTDVTPENPRSLSLFLPPSAPFLINARISILSSTNFEVSVNGLSTTKSLLSLEMTLISDDGGANHTVVDLRSFSQIWFGTPLSDFYGGLFSVTVPFRAPIGSSRVQSIRATVRSELGQSNAVTVNAP